jgi:hypothetical protein
MVLVQRKDKNRGSWKVQLLPCFLLAMIVFFVSHHFMVRSSIPRAPQRVAGIRKDSQFRPVSKQLAACQCVMCESDPICGGLWKGDAVGGDARDVQRIHVVVSHCENSLAWLEDFTRDFRDRILRYTIISKCGKNVDKIDQALVPTKIQLPNVGGCDHSFAHWLATQENIDLMDSDIVIFLKDSDRVEANIHQPGAYRSLADMLRISSQTGFSCGMEPTKPGWKIKHPTLLSAYHDTDALQTFVLNKYSRWKPGMNETEKTNEFKSKYKNLGDYHHRLNMKIPPNITQVCYGGSFAVRIANVRKHPVDFWARLEQSLSRGDNIEEGHFVERTWAALLATPLTNSSYIDSLRKFSSSILRRKGSIMGALQREMTSE